MLYHLVTSREQYCHLDISLFPNSVKNEESTGMNDELNAIDRTYQRRKKKKKL